MIAIGKAARRGAALILAGLAPLVLAACGDEAGGTPATGEAREAREAVPVEVAAVTRQDMAARYSTSSTLRASRRATVTTRTAGVIERLLVEEGARVREGQVLARLESDQQRIAWERAQSTGQTRERELERLQRLHEQDLVSDDDFEKARREATDAGHAADLARVELARTQIVAPFDGLVLRRHLDVGNTVTAGTPVYDLADVTPLSTDVTVPERHVARLQPGQQVLLTPGDDGTSVPARIERLAPEVDAATGTVKVTLAVEGDTGLRPGSFVRVDITTDVHQQALVVPRSALVAEGRRWYVYVLGDGGETVRKVEVEVGYEGRGDVEVRPLAGDEALVAGQRVVVAGAGALEDAAAVSVTTDRTTLQAEVVEATP